ncbi:MAG TPA: response regulator [Thermoanaerobaculia bacterium]|nr:response regulator [Thermoanaerobaculia bacterium]
MTTTKRTISGTRARGKGSEERFRLLLVEDDDLVAAGLTAILELERFTVLTIDRGLAVVEAIKSFKPHVVILDLTLPDVDGIEVFRRLRKRWPDLPVVFSTGYGSSADLTAELKRERVELLRKPYEIKELLAALQRITE